MKTSLVLLVAEGHKPPPLVDIDGTIFLQFGIFILLLFVLTKFVFRPYFALSKERYDNIDGAREEAQKLTREADERFKSYEITILNARKEAAQSRAQIREAGHENASQLLVAARSKSEEKISETREQIQKSAEAARLSLRTRIDSLSKAIATKLLEREV